MYDQKHTAHVLAAASSPPKRKRDSYEVMTDKGCETESDAEADVKPRPSKRCRVVRLPGRKSQLRP